LTFRGKNGILYFVNLFNFMGENKSASDYPLPPHISPHDFSLEDDGLETVVDDLFSEGPAGIRTSVRVEDDAFPDLPSSRFEKLDRQDLDRNGSDFPDIVVVDPTSLSNVNEGGQRSKIPLIDDPQKLGVVVDAAFEDLEKKD
jgi:hypothetical protein